MSIFTSLNKRSFSSGSPTSLGFIHRAAGNSSFIKRLTLTKSLLSHTGCVNTVQWNADGSQLISGGDDTRLCIWDYHQGGKLAQTFETGHMANIFCAKYFSPSLVVCCAGDYQVRAFDLNAVTSRNPTPLRIYDQCDGRVKKLVQMPDNNPHTFYACSEDGTVRFFDLRQPADSDANKVVVDLTRPASIEIYSIGVEGNTLACAGGDPYVRLYDIRALNGEKSTPYKRLAPPQNTLAPGVISTSMRGHITGIAFKGTQIVANYSSDAVYLFDVNKSADCGPEAREQYNRAKVAKNGPGPRRTAQKPSTDKMDVEGGKGGSTEKDLDEDDSSGSEESEDEAPRGDDLPSCAYYEKRYEGLVNVRTVKEVNFFGPSNEFVISGSDDGNIFIWDKETTEVVNVMHGDRMVVNCIQGHPIDSFILASSGIDYDVKLWHPGDPPAAPKQIPEIIRDNLKSVRRSEFRFRSMLTAGGEQLEEQTHARGGGMEIVRYLRMLHALGGRRRPSGGEEAENDDSSHSEDQGNPESGDGMDDESGDSEPNPTIQCRTS